MSSVIHFIQFMSIVLLLTRIKKNMVTHRFARSFVFQTIVYALMTQKKLIQTTITLKAIHCFSFHLRNGSYSLSLAFFFSPRSLPPSLNSHSLSRLLSFKWRNDLPSIELPAFFHCVLFLITAYIYYCIYHMHTLYMRHNIPSQWLVFVLMFCVGLLFCCFCCWCGCCCWLYSVVLRSLGRPSAFMRFHC